MAFLNNVLLAFLAMLMLALHLDLTSAGVTVLGIRAHDLSGADPPGNPADAYVKVWCGDVYGGTTGYRTDTDYPRWSAEFSFPNCKGWDKVTLQLWDSDWVYDDHLITCTARAYQESDYYSCHDKIVGTLYWKLRLF